jgi:thiamine biosynthesis lipoprotein
VQHDLVETTVLGPDPARAAAWATALLCLGPEEGARIADREGLAATMAVRSGNSVLRTHSARFAADWTPRPKPP